MQALIPFAWNGVTLHASGAAVLRARLRRAGPDAVQLLAADSAGAPVITVDSLALRPVSAAQLETAGGRGLDGLYALRWVPAPVPAAVDAGPVAVTGPGAGDLAAALAAAGTSARAWPGLAGLAADVAAGGPAPRAVLAAVGGGAADAPADGDGGGDVLATDVDGAAAGAVLAAGAGAGDGAGAGHR